jgi:hypothetical protein
MQSLEVEYDLSFFDTDPYEPLPGGTMSLWPFQLGRFTELPYTLPQDFTLHHVLGESSPRLWLEKVAFLERWCGMALVNTHPDYLREEGKLKTYSDFLEQITYRGNHWHALPQEVARWWRLRGSAEDSASLAGAVEGVVRRHEDGLVLVVPSSPSGRKGDDGGTALKSSGGPPVVVTAPGRDVPNEGNGYPLSDSGHRSYRHLQASDG